MLGQRLGLVHLKVGCGVEIDLMASAEKKTPVAPHRLDLVAARDGIDVFGHLPHQAGDDGKVGAMPDTGQRQRPVEAGPDAGHLAEDAALLELTQKAVGGAHRPDRMRARWADADAKHFEDAVIHAASSAISPFSRRTTPKA